MWSRNSRRTEPMSLSTEAFCQGDRGATGRSRMPIARIRCKKTGPYDVSRSRMRYRGAWSHGNASVTWREIHSDPIQDRDASIVTKCGNGLDEQLETILAQIAPGLFSSPEISLPHAIQSSSRVHVWIVWFLIFTTNTQLQ